MAYIVHPFGEWRGKCANIYEISGPLLTVGISDIGAAVQYIKVNAPCGCVNVCPVFGGVGEWLQSGSYCGATIGRVANRIGGARFSLGGRVYNLSQNEGCNCHHGGAEGFDRKFFNVLPPEPQDSSGGNMLQLSLLSPDGDMGFPGALELNVTYKVSGNSLKITYTAVSDKDTLWAPTCHAYFNLNGTQNTSLGGNMLQINADSYTPVGKDMLPVGELQSVDGTPFDFRRPRDILEGLECSHPQLAAAGGFDHNFSLRGEHAARAYGVDSGIVLDVYTDMPGLHFYSGNFLKGKGPFGKILPRSAFALEAQFFPDAANIHAFKKPLLPAGIVQSHYIEYSFGFIQQSTRPSDWSGNSL